MTSQSHFAIVGAGLAGTLLAILLAQRGYRVQLIERRADPRQSNTERGRSINLALAARGLHALGQAGLAREVESLLIPMQGRMLHDIEGVQTFVPYGQGAHEVIYSISRGGLNELLLNAADRERNVSMTFSAPVTHIGVENGRVRINSQLIDAPLIAADGAGSVVRRAMVDAKITRADIDLLTHGYKELTLSAGTDGAHAFASNALHIWPRGGFMLIALPNLDGSFTVTLFLSREGSPSFAQLATPRAVRDFFTEEFADAAALIPALEHEFFAHPIGEMGTVRTTNWALDDRLLLIGDAAHAIVPFHGQGMNCALEDCGRLVDLLEKTGSVADAFAAFTEERRPQANAIADMALENYVEMRDTVRDPKFLVQKALSLELERRFPARFIPRYSMVMFHHEIPYAVAYDRGRIQAQILRDLTEDAESIAQVDYTRARTLIEAQLPPLFS